MSNTISLIRGTSKALEVDLVDENGNPIMPKANCDDHEDDPDPKNPLVGATATFTMRNQPTDLVNVLLFTTTLNPSNLSIDTLRSVLLLSFAPTDTAALPIQLYFYQIEVTLVTGEVFLVIPWNLLDLNLGGAAATPTPPFLNTVKITQDYPLSNDMTYMTPGGSPIPAAQIRLYYKSDYDAGNLNTPLGITTTDSHGKWTNPILVLPGYTYTARFEKMNEYGPDKVEFFA